MGHIFLVKTNYPYFVRLPRRRETPVCLGDMTGGGGVGLHDGGGGIFHIDFRKKKIIAFVKNADGDQWQDKTGQDKTIQDKTRQDKTRQERQNIFVKKIISCCVELTL